MTRLDDRDLDDLLRAMDPARGTGGDADRAAADLDRILAAPTGSPTPTRPARTPRRRLAWLLPVAAGVTGLLVVGPDLLGSDTAYASWSAVPTGVPIEDQEAALRECVDFLSVPGGPAPSDAEGLPTAAELTAAELVLAERRGEWTFTVVAVDGGAVGECLLHDAPGLLGLFGGYDNGAGSLGVVDDLPALAADRVDSYGGFTGSGPAGSHSSIIGRAGTDVTAVTVHAPDGQDVTATLSGGSWAAWWPADVDPGADMDHGALSATVELADGTTSELTYEQMLPVQPDE